MNKNKYLPWVAGIGLVASLAIALPVFAQGMPPSGMGGPGPVRINGGEWNGMHGTFAPGVFGTVSAVNGTTLTVMSKSFIMRMNATSTATTTSPIVYTVDASSATVLKNGTSSTVSAIATGDTVMVQGTVTDTNVIATTIRDGIVPMMGRGPGGPGMGRFGKGMGRNGTSTPAVSPIQGNGEPIVGGNITAVSGTTITITNTSNVTYTIDASNATIIKNGTSTAITNLATGDSVIVQGTVNGNSVTASSVIDQGMPRTSTSTASGSSGSHGGGFFGAIGSFFKHLFGF